MHDENGNLADPGYKSKKQVMRLIGGALTTSERRTNPEMREMLEKDGVFNMEEEMAQITSMMEAQAGPTAPEQPVPQQVVKKMSYGK